MFPVSAFNQQDNICQSIHISVSGLVNLFQKVFFLIAEIFFLQHV